MRDELEQLPHSLGRDPDLVAISSFVGSWLSFWVSWRRTRSTFRTWSPTCTGRRIVRPWSASAREIACRIHQSRTSRACSRGGSRTSRRRGSGPCSPPGSGRGDGTSCLRCRASAFSGSSSSSTSGSSRTGRSSTFGSERSCSKCGCETATAHHSYRPRRSRFLRAAENGANLDGTSLVMPKIRPCAA